jgi:hypothetical protein
MIQSFHKPRKRFGANSVYLTGVADVPVTQISVQYSGYRFLVCQGIAAGMSQHVQMSLDTEIRWQPARSCA